MDELAIFQEKGAEDAINPNTGHYLRALALLVTFLLSFKVFRDAPKDFCSVLSQTAVNVIHT